MINGITFSEQLITSANFAHFMYTFLNKANGITKGCGISHADGRIYVQKGYFVEFGRMVQVVGVEEIESPNVLSGQLYCKVVFEIDLTKTNTADGFNQGYFKTLSSTDTYPAVTKEDLDNGGSLYQMPWCQYIKKTDGISEFRDLREILNLDSIWSAISGQNTTYKAEFDKYFTAQRTAVEQMIAALEAEGYLTLEEARRNLEMALPAAGWSAAAPYSQTVNVIGITEYDSPIIYCTDDVSDKATMRRKKKAFSCITRCETGVGTITFFADFDKPAEDLKLVAKGV